MTHHHPPRSPAGIALLAVATVTIVLAFAGVAHAGIPTANPSWQWQNPWPHGDDLSNMCFVDANHAWAVGLTRGFIYTTDAGTSWSANRTGPPLGFLDVDFADADHAWAVGESSDKYEMTNRALMERSTDGGATWSEVYVGAAPTTPLGAVDFQGAVYGWTVGRFGTALHTSDGGTTWALGDTPDESKAYDFTAVSFTSTSTGWAFGDESGMKGMVLATTDSGETWAIAGREDVPLWTGDAWGTQTAWAAGMDLKIVFTTDGGATWADATTPAAIGFEDVLVIEFSDGLQGVACTNGGRILRSTDGGANWSVVYAGDGTPLGTIDVSGLNGLALGGDGLTVASSDGGATWTEISTGPREVIGRLSFTTANVGWACGAAGTILNTADGGAHWAQQTSGTTRDLYGIDFVSTTRGWTVGAHGLIKRTTNGGTTWTSQRSGTTYGLGGLDFISSSRGWVVGSDGLVKRTTDGGRTWSRQRSGTTAAFLDVQFLDRYRGWACGEKGTLARTTNGGRTWSRTHLRVLNWPGGYMYSLCFVSRSEGWVCGVSPAGVDTLGVVFHTSDGGRTWTLQGPTRQKTVAEMTLSGIDFIDAQHGWVVGEYGFLMWTDNGGKTWQESIRPTPDEDLLDVNMVSATTGYASGTGGTIINTTSGGH